MLVWPGERETMEKRQPLSEILLEAQKGLLLAPFFLLLPILLAESSPELAGKEA